MGNFSSTNLFAQRIAFEAHKQRDPLQVSQLEIAVMLWEKVPGHPSSEGLRKRVAIEALCDFSSANSLLFPPPYRRLHCILVDLGT